MKILLSGGGTMGSVSPLLALAAEIKKRDQTVEFLWIGTVNGPEKYVVTDQGINYQAISSGRWRRFFSLNNLFDIFRIIKGYRQARKIIAEFKPDILLTAGSFVAAPVARAASRAGVRVFVHQQDLEIGLANRLMAKYAEKITITFEKNRNDFIKLIGKNNEHKIVLTGNPARSEFLKANKDLAREKFGINNQLPVLLVMGGGTGAAPINKLLIAALPKLLEFCQIIHIAGLGKITVDYPRHENYHVYEFIDDMGDLYAMADIVITRGGIGSLTELAILGKSAIIMPIPRSSQEENAAYFSRQNAAITLLENKISPSDLAGVVKELLNNPVELKRLSRNISQIVKRDGAKNVVDLIPLRYHASP